MLQRDYKINFVILTFQSVFQILWCYHSNETSLGELFHTAIYFLGFCKTEISFCEFFLWLL